eukprot:TRINITY_DN12888_c0_g1_i1.p1 TRINITY_DN12888_c0_g1~~TRINITY_DN12888_c0_g1_i1.p1  ORF type:complete len:244 (-),score=63.42 TRINITY_DN12888_c0_g1_i1:96-827(-)
MKFSNLKVILALVLASCLVFQNARGDWDAAATGTEERLVEEIEEVVVIERVAVEVPASSSSHESHSQPQQKKHEEVTASSTQRDESGEDIEGDRQNLVQRLVEHGKGYFDSAKGFIQRELQLERLRGLWERREKVWDLLDVLKKQNSILWVILFSLPFVVYGVLLPDKASAGSSVDASTTAPFVEYGLPGEVNREYTQQQIREYTELQLKGLDLYCNAPEASPKDKEIYRVSIQRAAERAKER